MNYGCSSEVIGRLSKYSEVVLESALASTLPLTNPRSPDGVAIANVRLAAAKSKREAHPKGICSKRIWNYKRKKTVCRRCQQPGHIARDCTTNIQALARSDQPAASREGTGSGEVAGTRGPPAKRQRWTTNKSDYKQEKTVCCRCQQPGHIARDCTTDIKAIAQSDQPAASGKGTGSSEVAGTQAPPAKRQRRTTKKLDYSSSLSFSVSGDGEQDLVA